MRMEEGSRKRNAVYLAVAVLVAVGLTGVIFSRVFAAYPRLPWFARHLSALVIYVCATALLAFFLKRFDSLENWGFHLRAPAAPLAIMAASAAAVFTVFFINGDGVAAHGIMLLAYLAIAVAAAVFEAGVFCGAFFFSLRTELPPALAAFVTALVYTLYASHSKTIFEQPMIFSAVFLACTAASAGVGIFYIAAAIFMIKSAVIFSCPLDVPSKGFAQYLAEMLVVTVFMLAGADFIFRKAFPSRNRWLR